MTEKDLSLNAALLPYVSAQLRATMVGIYTAMQRLAPPDQRSQDPKLDRNAAQMSLCYHQLLRLAGNLSAVDRFQSGEPLRRENTDLVTLCGDLCRQAESLFALRDVALHFSSDTPSLILALDHSAFERLLLNLLSNALKFTPSGGSVTVHVKKPSGGFVRLSVTDTGCGIPAERRSLLFPAGVEDALRPIGPQGLGLGLPLCHYIAKAHGGRILAESGGACGTRVVVSLPTQRLADNRLSDSGGIDYTGGFNHLLVELSDALPSGAYTQCLLD